MFHLLCQVIECLSYPIQRFYNLFPRSLYFKSFIIFTVGFFFPFLHLVSNVPLFSTDAGEPCCLCNPRWGNSENAGELPRIFRISSERLCHWKRLLSSNFPLGASGNVEKGIPKHRQRPPALAVKPDDRVGRVQLFSSRVWFATGQCLSTRWCSRPWALVVMCRVFTFWSSAEQSVCPFQ